jgi:hypothetical protein
MIGNLEGAIKTLLAAALPALLGGATPAIALTVQSDKFEIDLNSSDAPASAPRPDDQVDQFAFDPTGIIFDPADPAFDPSALPKFTLSKPPYPGPKRVRLLTSEGDRIALRENEVIWDAVETRNFTLALAPTRDLAGVNGVSVLYGVIALFTMLKVNQLMLIQLESSTEPLDACEALVTGIIELHRQELLDNSLAAFDADDYRATVKANSLKLLEGSSPRATQRQLNYQVEIELKITRALREDEGRPIERIRTPGQPLDPARPVDVAIGVDV